MRLCESGCQCILSWIAFSSQLVKEAGEGDSAPAAQ